MATRERQDSESKSSIGEIIRVVIHALILALIVRTLLFQPFNIPSGSMKSTLLIGDYLFVSKYSYGYSRHSFHFSPNLFAGRVWAGVPERGDVVVFKLPRDNATDYIKRVIGLPGDRIQMLDGVLQINGQPVAKERIENFTSSGEGPIPRFRETLPNGVSYEVLDLVPDGAADNTMVYEVPDGHYFVMGDNRDNSIDSRALANVGYVPEENLIGRAEIIFFSITEGARFWEFWRWPSTIRWERLFRLVD